MKTKIKFIEPNTPEWFRQRIGKFTSSECSRLLGNGKRQMTESEIKQRDLKNKAAKAIDPKAKNDVRTTVDTLFSKGSITYINEKVAEIINKKAKYTPLTKPMQWGLDNESDAIEMYTKITGRKMVPSGLFILNDFTGGTPDAMRVVRGRIVGINEVKCLNSENHSELCGLITSEHVREFDESFYSQSQMNMMVCGEHCKWCDLISYDPRAMGYDDNGDIVEENFDESKFVFAIHIIRIKRDEEFIKELEMRLSAAVDILIEKLGKRMKAADRNKKMYERTLKRLNKAS